VKVHVVKNMKSKGMVWVGSAGERQRPSGGRMVYQEVKLNLMSMWRS